MEQFVEVPSQQDMDKISQLLMLSATLAAEVVGKQYDGGLDDLVILQTVFDSHLLNAETTLELQSLGMSLGQVLANEDTDFDWWMVVDDNGRDPCLRYQKTDLLVFPQTFLSKRVEQGEAIDVAALYNNLVRDLNQVKQQNFGAA